MPWTTPSNVAAGDAILASKWNTDVVANTMMGQPVFTNEAARDAAIAAPAEGQVCYLTAPTVPAATGGSTYIPSGIATVYNGSVWVCVTPVGAFTSNTGTTTSRSYTTSLSGTPGTNPSITLVTGTTAMIGMSALMVTSTGTNGAQAAIAISVSGASTISPSGETQAFVGNATYGAFGHSVILGGLTAGTNTFTLNYLCAVEGTGTFSNRKLWVAGIA